jgi:hypothetical protein
MAENETVDVSVAPVETSTTTEAETTAPANDNVPDEVKKALKKANKEAETLRLKLKEYEDRDKTEAQKLQEERDALKSERDSLYLENLRREVADEKGLTPAQARRLVGTTREELEADADDVIAAFPVNQKPTFGNVGQGATRGENAQRVYTTTEIQNHEFFMKHKDDILLAQREGRIVTA